MSQMVNVSDALKLLAEHAPKRASEACELGDALGRTLSEPVIAKVSRPPAAVSAMDGYAVALSDVSTKGARLKVIGTAPAGTPFTGAVTPGQAVRIFTGGELPTGTNHVVPQENTASDQTHVTINQADTSPRFVRAAGRDFVVGDTVLEAGTHIGPAHLAVAAAANHSALPVFTRPKVALLANGDELMPPGSNLRSGQIINSNPYGLSAMIARWGGVATDLETARDSVASIQDYAAKAVDADIIVPVGGASVGDHDHMRRAFAEMGFTPVFEKIAVKPGKPTWFSKNDKQLVLGLPGNPASAFVCAQLFLRPLIDQAAQQAPVKAMLAADVAENGPRAAYLRAKYKTNETGQLIVTPATDQDSSLLTPFLSANCLIKRDKNALALKAGALVTLHLLD